jgi:hypothetical protein
MNFELHSAGCLFGGRAIMSAPVQRRRASRGLRSYGTIGRAQAYARQLATRFPGAVFVVELSPFASYAFRWLIRVQRGNGRIIGGAYVGR